MSQERSSWTWPAEQKRPENRAYLLGYLDSNQDDCDQNAAGYHYLIPQGVRGTPTSRSLRGQAS